MNLNEMKQHMARFHKSVIGQQDVKQRNADAFERYRGLTLVEMVQTMADLAECKEYLENLLKVCNAEHDTLRIKLIPDKIEADGLESPVTIAGVGRVSLTDDLTVTVGEKDDFYKWLHKHKMGDLITESVNSSTLKAWVKERIKENKPYPTECLKVTPFTRASITRVKE